MKTRQNAQHNFLVSTTVALLVIGLATVAVAQGSGQGRGQGQGQRRGGGGSNSGQETRMERMTQRLDLTADQVTVITEIRATTRLGNQEMRKQVMRLKNEQRGEMLKDEPSSKKVLDLTVKIGDMKTNMQANRMNSRLEVRKVLTPEQRDKMLMAGAGCGNGGQRGQKGQRGQGCGSSDNGGFGQRGQGSGRGNSI